MPGFPKLWTSPVKAPAIRIVVIVAYLGAYWVPYVLTFLSSLRSASGHPHAFPRVPEGSIHFGEFRYCSGFVLSRVGEVGLKAARVLGL